MVLVDTTVWIDFFAGRNEPHVMSLQELIENEEDLSLCGVILAEVLQGIRSDARTLSKQRNILAILFSCPCGRQHFYERRRFTGPFERRGLQFGNQLIV
jgi:predicted nucleic acid-binding protein